MAGIGDSWGTREELLHPRGPDGRWIRKAGVAKGIIDAVLGFLANFRPRQFQSRGQASQYLQNASHRQGVRRMGRADHIRLANDLSPANADLQDGVIDEPSTQRFVQMMDRSATELPDDVILTRIVGVDAFGFTPETAKGTSSDTDPGIRSMSGKLVADRGYGLTSVGGPEGPPPAGTVRMVIAAKKGTKVIIPAAGPNDTTVLMDRGQPLRVTKIAPDGAGGWTMYATAEPDSGGRDVPEPIGGQVGVREPSKDREARIRQSSQALAELDKVPDDQKEQEDEQARAARAAEAAQVTPVPSPQQEAERRRLEVAQQNQQQPPRQPAPGEPPPRTEPPVGRVGEAPAAGQATPVTPTTGTPEPTPVPRRVVDIRRAVLDAGIPSPSRGEQLREWNEAYLGLKSGRLEPDEAIRGLDANIRHNRGLVEDLGSRPGNEARIADLEENIKAQEGLRDLIREQYDIPAPGTEATPAPTPVKAVPRTEAGLPRQEGLTPVKKAAPRKKAAKKTAPAKKTAQQLDPSSNEGREQTLQDILGHKPTMKELRELAREHAKDLGVSARDTRVSLIDKILGSPTLKAKKAASAREAPAKKAVPEAAGDLLDQMTKQQLLDEAERREVKAPKSWTKDKIKALLREEGFRRPEKKTPEQRRKESRGQQDLQREFEQRETQGESTPAPAKKAAKKAAPSRVADLDQIAKEAAKDPDTVRTQLISTQPEDRAQYLEDLITPLNLTESRAMAKSLGVKSAGRSQKPEIIQAILRHFEGVDADALEGRPDTVTPESTPGAPAYVNPRNVNVGDLVEFQYGPDGKKYPKGQEKLVRIARIERTGEKGNNNRYQFLDEDGNLITSKAPNGKMNIRRGGAPDREQGARDRQVRIDQARKYGDLAAEIEELVNGEAEPDVVARGIARVGRGLPPEELDTLIRAAESGNFNDVRFRMGNLMQAQGVNLFDRPGAVERFDRRRHEAVGADIPDDAMVHVVRPGVEATIDGEHLWLRRATVEVATPQETVREEQAQRLVPEGSVPGARTQAPVDNAPRKRELRQAWIAADIQPPPGPVRNQTNEIRDRLLKGEITPEESIRMLESEIALNKEDLAELDAHIREGDLTGKERDEFQRRAAKLIQGIEAQEKASKFLRLYFEDEAPAVSLKEAKIQDPVSYEFLKDATPDDLREAAKEAGLDAPSGDTPDEMFTDLLKQVARNELARRAAKKAAKKAPAKKAAKKAAPAPEVPKERERIDARLVGAGIEFDENDSWVKRVLDDTQKDLDAGDKTPAAIGRELDDAATRRMTTAVYMHGAWHAESVHLTDEERAERKAEDKAEIDRVRAEADKIRELGARLQKTRRKPVKKAAPAAPEVQKLQGQVDDLQKRRIDDVLGELSQSGDNRDRGDAALEGLTMEELRRLADQAGIPRQGRNARSKRGLRDAILDRFFPEAGTPTGPRTTEQHVAALNAMNSHQDVEAYLANVKGVELDSLARHYSAEHIRSATGRRAAIAEAEGFRITRPGAPGAEMGRAAVAPSAPAPRTRSLGVRAREAGIAHPGETFSDVDSAVGEADRRLEAGESPTVVARFLRERAARVAKADINEEGRRFKTEKDPDSLRSIRKASAEYLRRIGTHVQQEGKASRPAKKAAPSAPEAPSAPSPSRTATSPVGGAKSTKPILDNSWGGRVTDVHFHRDGIIGQELRSMGDDQALDVDGEPLANVVGKLATDAVMGRISQDQMIQRLQALAERLPEGSIGRRQVESMAKQLDAPKRAPLDLPDGTPAPMVDLMRELSEIPLARGTDRLRQRRNTNEMDTVQALAQQAQERYPGNEMRQANWLAEQIRQKVVNHRHESEEGKFQIDRAARKAMEELEQIVARLREAARSGNAPTPPPVAKKATPRLTTIPGGRTGEGRSRGRRPTLRVVRNEDGEFSLVLVT